MATMIQTAQASFTDTLYDLVNHANGSDGTLSIDHKLFSGFSITASGLTSFDPNKIIVTASESGGVEYLTWSGNISLASGGTATADLLLKYIVQVTPGGGPIDLIDQAYTGSGVVGVAETVSTDSGGVHIVGHSNLGPLDLSDPLAEANDVLGIVPPESLLYVTKDISLATIPGNGNYLASISQVTQSFHQVPEPTTVIAGALLLLPLGASTLRILRRNRMS